MSYWKPISLIELGNLIRNTQWEGDEFSFWNLIKVDPVKWIEKAYGEEGGGFWIVAICGATVVWYNDVEEGFNISTYSKFGEIDQYNASQDKLNWTILSLLEKMRSSDEPRRHRGTAQPLL